MIPGQGERDVRVVVVGAGFSGLGAGIRLREAGFRDVLVLEKAEQLGGTWRDNTYPGCACDVPSTLYSYSFAPDAGWSRVFAGQEEIRAYLAATAERYGLAEVLRCGVALHEARWDPAAGRWQLETSDGSYSAAVLVMATGPWHVPRTLDVPGIDGFAGPVLHTARWDDSVDLAGKRVSVVGSGASAVQVVPAITGRAAAVHVFQRTAQWVLPKPDLALSPRSTRSSTGCPAPGAGCAPPSTPCRRASATPSATPGSPASSKPAPGRTFGSPFPIRSCAGPSRPATGWAASVCSPPARITPP
ncbi:flavin-containing monooxygenase [Streptomyces vinaceus]|uniref:flavin-containing monooxygenase n=1 Tax=Streptomyces vinaceus TaxID=1960 RepID=UPI001FCB8FA0|nr:NAD(P)/FAD-dependent oxidoreductase [Streptomyces vinaceus]